MEKNKTKQKNPKKGQDKNRMFKLFGIFSLIILLPLVSSVTYTSPEDVYSDFNWIDYDDANVEANYGGIDFTYGDSNNLVGYIRPTISPGLNTSLLFGVASGSSTSTILSLIGSTGYVGIGTTAPFQKLHVNGSILANGTISSSKLAINNNNTPLYFLTVGNQSATNYSLVSAYFEGNITSAGYITRTSTFDSSKNVWDYVKDATFYKTDNIIDDTKFYGYTTWNTYQIDYSKPVIIKEEYEICTIEMIEGGKIIEGEEQKEICLNATRDITTYPYTLTIKNEGVILDKEIDLLRQAVFELKQENSLIKSELCKKDNTYIWCLGVVK